MNVKNLIAVAALAALGTSAFAEEARDFPTPSTLSRATVVAELVRAQNAGEIQQASETDSFQTSVLLAAQKPGLSRATVKHGLAKAGGITVANETYGTVEAGQSLRKRSEVGAE